MELLESREVRVRFVLFVLLLANAAACAEDAGTGRGDGAVDRASATAVNGAGTQAGPTCTVDAAVSLNPSVVDVLIVFDGSESMGIGFGQGTRYSVVADVLSNLVDTYQWQIRFGFAQFPGADALCPGETVAGCCAGLPSAEIASGNGTAIEKALKNVLPLVGNTPTALALQRARKYYKGLADGAAKRYVLLATDGLPSCTLLGALSASQPGDADGGLPNACQDAVAQVQALADDGIKVAVLAVGAELSDDPAGPPACLDQMAQAGGMPSLYSAASPASLQATLDGIFAGVRLTSCSFELDPAPASPSLVSVYLDGQQIPKDTEDGWSLFADDAGNTPQISIGGEYCDLIQHFRYSSIEARYGCLPCADKNSCQ